MYYPSIIPHAELFAPEEYMAKHRGKYDPEKSFSGVDDGETYRLGPYGSQPKRMLPLQPWSTCSTTRWEKLWPN
jgi:hypothetical protein